MKIFCSITSCDTDTYKNSVNWSTSGDSNIGFTAVTALFFMDMSTAMYLLKSDWCCQNFSVPSAYSWAVPIFGG